MFLNLNKKNGLPKSKKNQNHELTKEFYVLENGNHKLENEKLKHELNAFDKQLSNYKQEIENLKQEIQKRYKCNSFNFK